MTSTHENVPSSPVLRLAPSPGNKLLSTPDNSRSRLHTKSTAVGSPSPCISPRTPTPPPSRSSSLSSGELVSPDDEHINNLYARRDEIKVEISTLESELLDLLYEEWNLTGQIPAELRKNDVRSDRCSLRLTSTSYPMRQFMVNRANTFSYHGGRTRINRKDHSTPSPPQPHGFSAWPVRKFDSSQVNHFPLKSEKSLIAHRPPKAPDYPDQYVLTQTSHLPHDVTTFRSAATTEDSSLPTVPTTESSFQLFNGKSIDATQKLSLDDTVNIERLAVELKLRRLEIDYAVVSQLREIHKQKATETKKDAYKLAYKTNCRKLKQIVSEITSLKEQLVTNATQIPPRKSLKPVRGKKYSSVSSLTQGPCGFPSLESRTVNSTPVTPCKFGQKAFHSDDKEASTPKADHRTSKFSRRSSLLPILRLFNPNKSNTRPSQATKQRIPSVPPLKCHTRETPAEHTDTYQSQLSQVTSISETKSCTPSEPNSEFLSEFEPKNPETGRFQSKNRSSIESGTFNQTSAALQNCSSPIDRFAPAHVFVRSRSLPESSMTRLREDFHAFAITHKQTATKSAVDFKPYMSRYSPVTFSQRVGIHAYPSKCSHFFPRRMRTATSNTSSNWSTSGCSCVSSLTPVSLSPEDTRCPSKLCRTTSTPDVNSRNSFDSTDSSVSKSKSTKTTAHNPSNNGELSHITRTTEAFEDKLATLASADEDDEGYVHSSDNDSVSDEKLSEHIIPENCLTSKAFKLHSLTPESDAHFTKIKRSSLRPISLLKRTVSRMSSKCPAVERRPPLGGVDRCSLRAPPVFKKKNSIGRHLKRR